MSSSNQRPANRGFPFSFAMRHIHYRQSSCLSAPEPPRGTVKLSRILRVWRRNRSALERRINNLGSVQGAE